MIRCYKCGKKINCSEVHDMGLTDNSFVSSGNYSVCRDCKEEAIKLFKEFMESDPEAQSSNMWVLMTRNSIHREMISSLREIIRSIRAVKFPRNVGITVDCPKDLDLKAIAKQAVIEELEEMIKRITEIETEEEETDE